MVSTGISMLVIAGLITAFITSYRTLRSMKQTQAMNQELRYGLNALATDLSMAGYGVTAASNQLSAWFSWVSGFTTNPQIQAGTSASDPDRITMAGAFGPKASTLGATTAVNATTLNLAYGTGYKFNSTDRRVIFVGNLEMARVVGMSGDTLTLSTDPATNGVGLRNAYAIGTPVELVKVLTYSCTQGGSNAVPYLVRDPHVSGVTDDEKRIAGGLENLKFRNLTNALAIAMTARTDTADPHPSAGDGYRRNTLTTTVYLRNRP